LRRICHEIQPAIVSSPTHFARGLSCAAMVDEPLPLRDPKIWLDRPLPVGQHGKLSAYSASEPAMSALPAAPRNTISLIFAVILAAGMTAGGGLIAHAIRDARNFDQSVEVRGLAEQAVKSDQASWQLNFTTFGGDALSANRAWADKMQALEKTLQAKGFAAASIRRLPLIAHRQLRQWRQSATDQSALPRQRRGGGGNEQC